MPAFHELVRRSLPRLTAENYRVSSSATWDYNCVAWAVGVTNAWWWPLERWYSPEGVARAETIPAFMAAFANLGYTPGSTPDLEAGIEKVALYAVGETPTHAARQLPDGRWTSKLGPSIDIEHTRPEDVAGGTYGGVV